MSLHGCHSTKLGPDLDLIQKFQKFHGFLEQKVNSDRSDEIGSLP